MPGSSTQAFINARSFLLQYREDYAAAYRGFVWPELSEFNWAFDWFDHYARGNSRVALWIVREGEGETKHTFAELAEQSSSVAAALKKMGMNPGDRVLLMLPNMPAIWQTVLGSMKLGLVVVPTSTQATVQDLQDRVDRASIKLVITDESGAQKFQAVSGTFKKVIVGKAPGWVSFDDLLSPAPFVPTRITQADDPCLLYFTSGTTAKPKQVLHTHRSYPVGHLSTMYWIGIQEGDVHQNISAPGWAKHAWSSFFAPWNAGATIFIHEAPRFAPALAKHWIAKAGVNTFCAPPTVWRMLILESLGKRSAALRELASAGEPLNAEVIEKVKREWGLTIRDGFGQTETTAQIGNSVGQVVKPGSMGRPLPGYRVALLNDKHEECSAGEIALSLGPRPAGLMSGYADDPALTQKAMAHGYYRTGDEASLDGDGYIHFIGRGDDVFKSSDYRLSPFELESVLLEHPHVAEAAVVPSPDDLRLSVPKAFITLKPGIEPTSVTAHSIFEQTNAKLASYKRIRRIEFCELPKTISGKIRRVQLKQAEEAQVRKGARGAAEFWS